MGPMQVPNQALWGAQTQRALEHFAISVEVMPQPLIHALAHIKRAAALTNAATRLRIDSVRATSESASGHPTTCCSAALTA